MANQRHVDILLRDGVRVWNAWRKVEVGTEPDLFEADLKNADLRNADLHEAVLIRAELTGADLTGADLTRAYLMWADLTGANLTDAFLVEALLSSGEWTDAVGRTRYRTLSELEYPKSVLQQATLNGANLSGVHLRGAVFENGDWQGAHLSGMDLSQMNLHGARLSEADLESANLNAVDLGKADLKGANLRGANLTEAILAGADLRGAVLVGADLTGANLSAVQLDEVNLHRAKLTGLNLAGLNLSGLNLSDANLSQANLTAADLTAADLTRADLTGADLSRALCLRTNFAEATLRDCQIYGISAWDLNLDFAQQADLRITPPGNETNITVDNLEVAQFLYLLLNNQKMRSILDTITSKVVLVLGRFSLERKRILDAIREALRHHPNGYIPVLFDFAPQQEKPVLETVKTLAHLARFIIADLTDPSMVRSELTYITSNVPTVPIQPVIMSGTNLPTEYETWALYKSFLPVYRYADSEHLLASLTEAVIAPIEGRVVARRLADADRL